MTYLSKAAVKRIYGIPIKVIHRAVESREIAYTIMSKRKVFSEAQVKAYLARIETPAEPRSQFETCEQAQRRIANA